MSAASLLDMTTAKRQERRDGIPCFVISEPEPSKVVHLFHPIHPDYEPAKCIYETLQEVREAQNGYFA